MEVITPEALAARREIEKQRRLERLAKKVNEENAKKQLEDSSSTTSDEDGDKDQTPADNPRKRKDRASVSSQRNPAKKKNSEKEPPRKDASSGGGRGGAKSSTPARRQLTTSQTFPKADWPPGYTEEQIDMLTPKLVLQMKALWEKAEQEKAKEEAKKVLPGYKMCDQEVIIPVEFIEAGEDDATEVFCPGRFRRMPISLMKKWWEKLPLEWKPIVPEYGAEERGMLNRVPRETWEGAHDRTRWWEIRHWCSFNANNYTKEKDTKVKLLDGGEVSLKGGSGSE